jgi:hypothetical protein
MPWRAVVRENVFLVAAVLLPVAVIGVFLVASAIPRWRVPPPAYDLLLRTDGPYDQTRPPVAMDFSVRDGRVEARVRALAKNGYSQVPRLWLVDHRTLTAREIPVDLPADITEWNAPTIVPVKALADRRVIADAKAPDGYELDTRRGGSPGLVGDLFGMRSAGGKVSLVNRGRVVPIALPSNQYGYGHSAVGWIVNGGSR